MEDKTPKEKPAFEQLDPNLSKFIPEVEYDEYGQKKKSPYKQKPYEPQSEYEG